MYGAHMPESHAANYIVPWYLERDLAYYPSLYLKSYSARERYYINFSIIYLTPLLLKRESVFAYIYRIYAAFIYVYIYCTQIKIVLHKSI